MDKGIFDKVKENLGYYFGKYVAFYVLHDYKNLDMQEIILCLEELKIDNFDLSYVEIILKNKDKNFTKQYVIGYLDTSPIMNFPYYIPGINTTEETEIEFLRNIFDNDSYPGNIIYYHKKFIKNKAIFKYKKVYTEAFHPIRIDRNIEIYDLYAIKKKSEVNDVSYYETGIILCPPEGYYYEIIPHSSLINHGFIFGGQIIIHEEMEIVIPLISLYDENSISFPFAIGRIIPKKFIYSDFIYQ